VGPRAVLDPMVKRKIPSPRRESNPRTLIVQPIAQHYDGMMEMFDVQRLKLKLIDKNHKMRLKYMHPNIT